MTVMDVALYELYRQLKLFAPFHARCVELLHQQLTQYADIHRTASSHCLADLQASLLQLQEKQVSLRHQKEQQDARLQGLEAKARQAEELRRLLDIHTHLFGLQEVEALTVRQSEEEATAADWQWQKLLEQLEEIRFGHDAAGSGEVWLTRRTGEWIGREESDQTQQPFVAILPSVITLLPHETFVRGILDEKTNGRLLRVDVPPGRWSIGLAVTCSAPLDVSLLLLLAKRHESLTEKNWTAQGTPHNAKKSPGACGDPLRPFGLPTPHSATVPTLDPSLRLMCADRPQFSSFASFRVNPQEPQMLHARTPPPGAPDGGWLLIRLQPAHDTRACLLQKAVSRCRTAFTDQLSVPSQRCTPPNSHEAGRTTDSEQRLIASSLRAAERSTSARPGDAVWQAAEAGLSASGKDVLRFSVGVHVVYLHPYSTRADTVRQSDRLTNRCGGTLVPGEADSNTGNAPGRSQQISRARPHGGTGVRQEPENEDGGPKWEAMEQIGGASASAVRRKERFPSEISPRCRVQRNACVQTRKSRLLRGAIRNLHEGPRPPPVPQFCTCSETAREPGVSENTKGLQKISTRSHSCGSADPSNATAVTRATAGPDAPAPRVYAPSFPIFKVLLDETPVPLGDFVHLLQQGSRAAIDAATAPGVMTATNFPRWPPQLLAETAWVILLQRARERQWLARIRSSKEICRRQKLLQDLQHAHTQSMQLRTGQPQRRGRSVPGKRGRATKRKLSPSRTDVSSVVAAGSSVGALGSTESTLSPGYKPAHPADEEEYTRERNGTQRTTATRVREDSEPPRTAFGATHSELALPESFWDELESVLRDEADEEGSLAGFAFGFFLRRFNVAFLALKALHSFVLSLLYWSPLLVAVSAEQQKVAACNRNTRPDHSSIFAFGESSSVENSSTMAGSSSGQRDEHAAPWYSLEQRQQTEIDSQIRGFSPLFATHLFGRITGLLAAPGDTAPFRRALEDFSCLALVALVDQVAADQGASHAHQLKQTRLDRQHQALPETTTASLTAQAPGDHRFNSQPVSPVPSADGSGNSLCTCRVSQEEGLCLAITHMAAAKIAVRVFNEEGTAEYRAAVLTAINLHREAVIAAQRAAKKPRLRSRWARGILVITGRDRLSEKANGEKDTLALPRAVPGPGGVETQGSMTESANEEKSPGVATSTPRTKLDAHQEGWNLLLPVDLLIQVMAQQWEVLYVHLQQAMEMVLDKEVSQIADSNLAKSLDVHHPEPTRLGKNGAPGGFSNFPPFPEAAPGAARGNNDILVLCAWRFVIRMCSINSDFLPLITRVPFSFGDVSFTLESLCSCVTVLMSHALSGYDCEPAPFSL